MFMFVESLRTSRKLYGLPIITSKSFPIKKKRFNGGLEIYYAKKCHFWSFWAIVRCFGPLDRIKKCFFVDISLIFSQPVRNTLYISILEELDNIDS